jgi:DNA-binding NarL/FixJ family response regulator
VIIADDLALVRAGLRHILEAVPHLTILHAGAVSGELAEICGKLQPQLLILDTPAEPSQLSQLIRAVKVVIPSVTILVISAVEQPAIVLAALRAGATGYLRKSASEDEIRSAVAHVLRGSVVVSDSLAAHTLHQLALGLDATNPGANERLTRREHEVLQLLARGQTNREIAGSLSVSVGTVKIHVEHIIAKLGVTDRTQAAVRAFESGLI